MFKKCLKWFIIVIFISHRINCDLVILNLRINNNTSTPDKQICAIKKNVTTSDYNIQYNLIELTPYNGCTSIYNSSIANNAVLMRLNSAPNCSLEVILKNLELNRASLAIIGLNSSIGTNLTNSSVTISPIFLPIGMSNEIKDFLKQYSNPTVEVISTGDKYDFSLIVIWIIATFSVFFGSIWASYEFRENLKAKAAAAQISQSVKPINNNDNNLLEAKNNENQKNQKKSDTDEDPALLNVGLIGIIVLLVFVVAILLLLYFFYSYMIYFIYAIFAIGATTSMYRIFHLCLSKTSLLKCRIPKNKIPLLKKQPVIMDIIIALLVIGVCVVWFVMRNESWSWIVQNILALSLALNALSFYRLSSYKMVTIVLVLFFVYDVFMVFISPLITNGQSIMEAVAFGGRDTSGGGAKNLLDFNDTSREYNNRLPVVIIIPRLSKATRLCYYYLEYPFSLLGLGDILIPGLSVNYAILFDLASHKRIKTYFIANIIAYALGLFLAFIGLIFMEKAQPALFYLCPTHLIITYLVAVIRKEVKLLWSGDSIAKYAEDASMETVAKPLSRTDSLENIVENEQCVRINTTSSIDAQN